MEQLPWKTAQWLFKKIKYTMRPNNLTSEFTPEGTESRDSGQVLENSCL
jgi:hypothetical protein